MTHHTTVDFWHQYAELPEEIKRLADENFELLKQNPDHPSLQFKPVGPFWSARVRLNYRALAYRDGNAWYWFWIGRHDIYDRLLRRRR